MNTWRKMDNLVAETLHESLTAAKDRNFVTLFDVYVKLLIDTVADIYFCRGARQDTCDTLGDVQAVALIDTLADTLSEV